jgi:hypothetical protein
MLQLLLLVAVFKLLFPADPVAVAKAPCKQEVLLLRLRLGLHHHLLLLLLLGLVLQLMVMQQLMEKILEVVGSCHGPPLFLPVLRPLGEDWLVSLPKLSQWHHWATGGCHHASWGLKWADRRLSFRVSGFALHVLCACGMECTDRGGDVRDQFETFFELAHFHLFLGGRLVHRYIGVCSSSL